MKTFDKRHKWGEPERAGALLSRTCRVCGITHSVELMIRDDFLEALVNMAGRPNVYRAFTR